MTPLPPLPDYIDIQTPILDRVKTIFVSSGGVTHKGRS